MAAFLEIEVTFKDIEKIETNGLYVSLSIDDKKHDLEFKSPWDTELIKYTESNKDKYEYESNRRDLYYPLGYVESPSGPIIITPKRSDESAKFAHIEIENKDTNGTQVNTFKEIKANTLKLVKAEIFAFSKEIKRTNFVYFSPDIMKELFKLTQDNTFIFFGSEQNWGLNDTDQPLDIEAFGRSFTLGIKIKNIKTDLKNLNLYGVPLPEDGEPKMIAVLGNSCPYGWVNFNK